MARPITDNLFGIVGKIHLWVHERKYYVGQHLYKNFQKNLSIIFWGNMMIYIFPTKLKTLLNFNHWFFLELWLLIF